VIAAARGLFARIAELVSALLNVAFAMRSTCIWGAPRDVAFVSSAPLASWQAKHKLVMHPDCQCHRQWIWSAKAFATKRYH